METKILKTVLFVVALVFVAIEIVLPKALEVKQQENDLRLFAPYDPLGPYVLEENFDPIMRLQNFTITQNGSLIKDLNISEETAIKIAMESNLEIKINPTSQNRYPVVYPGDVFVLYTLRSGEQGWFKRDSSHFCLSYD